MKHPLIATAVALASVVFAPHAKADKFYIGAEGDDATLAEGSLSPALEGVLVEEKDGIYEIRIEGGTVFIAKTSVYKIENDGLTVADLDKRSADGADARKEADTKRQQFLTAEATLRTERSMEARAMEASFGGAEAVEAAAPALVPTLAALPVFDPIIGVSLRGSTLRQMLYALELEYELTGDRSLRKPMRILRRR